MAGLAPGRLTVPAGDEKARQALCLAGPHATKDDAYAVNELPQPQPPVAFGFLKLNPLPIIVVT